MYISNLFIHQNSKKRRVNSNNIDIHASIIDVLEDFIYYEKNPLAHFTSPNSFELTLLKNKTHIYVKKTHQLLLFFLIGSKRFNNFCIYPEDICIFVFVCWLYFARIPIEKQIFSIWCYTCTKF